MFLYFRFDFVATSTKDSFKIEKYENKGMIIKTIKDKTFDFETMPQVVINVKATDNLNTKYNDLLHTEFATVNIDVIEVNYKPPRIQLVIYYLNSGCLIYVLDPESNKFLVFTLFDNQIYCFRMVK